MYSTNHAIYIFTIFLFLVATINGEPLTCYSCSSDSLEICATLNFGNNSRELPVEICSDGITSCFTKVSNRMTVRGCKTPTMDCTNGAIDVNDEQCTACDSGKCNGNVYPEYRLHCLHCAGENCVLPSNSITVRYPCANYVENDSCYNIFSSDGQLAYRGCTSDNETTEGKRFCNRSPAQCEKCASRGCNNAEVQWEKSLSCIVCNSTDDENCMVGVDGDRDACERTTNGYKNHCYTRLANHTVARGCLFNAKTDIADDCNSWFSETCAICRHDYCNQKPIADEYCFECSTVDDANCTSKPDSYMRKKCHLSLEKSGCYRISESDDGESIRRGCASELNASDVVTCHIQDQRYCKLCSGNDCNRKAESQTCYVCSSIDDTKCAANVTALMQTECPNYVDQCITLIDSLNNDAIVRNCLRNVFTDDTFCRNNPSLCEACENDNCNSQLLVTNQTCYKCDSITDSNCWKGNLNDTMIAKCTLSVNNLGCYHSINESESTVRRGCLSDLPPIEYNECQSNQTACKLCQGPNCNNRDTFQQCYRCNSTENVDCIRATHWLTPVTCKAYNDECYVHIVNDVVTRGCLHESTNVNVQEECKDPDICERCNGKEGCNNKIVEGEFCMTCDSTIDPNCRTNLTIDLRTQCSLAVRPLGCYRFEDDGDLVKRGCLSDIRADERQMCRRQGDNCKTCLGDDCNTRISFQTCYACNSTASVGCIRGPSQFSAVTCRDYLDECYTRVINDTVDRGCLRQTAPSNEGLMEDCRDKDVCVTCMNNTLCNKKKVDGEFCLTCDSQIDPNCRTNVTFEMRKQCALSVKRMGCYRFEDDGDLVKRGCLSDIRPDERQMCRRQGDNCKTCADDDCNAKISFQQCHVCNSTESVNCIRGPSIFSAATCRDYMDECFTHVRNDTVVRGCISHSNNSLIKQDCDNNAITDYCDRCKDGECNNHTVEGEFCLTCDSNVNPNCRTNLTFEMRKQCSLAVRSLGCYLFKDDVNLVKRGCLSDVLSDERQMCRMEGKTCKTCLGDDCNGKITFQRCVICRTTSNDTACETNAALFNDRLCKYYADNCFTHVRNNITTRGCLQEQMNDLDGVNFQKECSDSDLCQKCDKHDGCNVASVVFETCGVQDSHEHLFKPAQCPKAVKALGCYRAIDKFTGATTRGCVSELPSPKRQLCREEGDTCKTCSSNSTSTGQVCNTLDSFTQCIGCDSLSNPNCAASPTAGMTIMCANYSDTCFTSLNTTNGQIRRGCLNEMSSQFVNACKANERNCKVCLEGMDACNNRSAGIERCIECDSRVDRNCINRLHLFGDGKVCNANEPLRWQGCYLSMEGGHVKRGCVSDIVDPEQKQNCSNGSDTCKTCDGRICNRKETFQSCHDCDSRKFEQCSQVNVSATVTCHDYMDTCVVSLKHNGHIRRGCSEQFTAAELAADSQFVKCADANCNGHIYPADRILCHRCNGGDNCQYLENEVNSTTLHPCPLYRKYDSCYSLLRNHNRMYRGCESDRSESQIECQNHMERCKMCNENGCNAHDRTRKPTLNCVFCNRTEECTFGQMPMSMIVRSCRNQVLFNEYESCFTNRTATGVIRGCTLDVDDNDHWCRDGLTSCSSCISNKCNRENAFLQFCHQCSGHECSAAQNGSSSIMCSGIFERPRAGCYTYIRGDENVTRGCFNNLNDQEVHDCHTKRNCTWCGSNNCNYQKSSASTATYSTIFLVLSVFFCTNYYS